MREDVSLESITGFNGVFFGKCRVQDDVRAFGGPRKNRIFHPILPSQLLVMAKGVLSS